MMSNSSENPTSNNRKKLIKWGGVVIVFVLVIGVAVYLAQDRGIIGGDSSEITAPIKVGENGPNPIRIPEGTSREDAVRTLTVEANSLSYAGSDDEATELFKQAIDIAGKNHSDAEVFIAAAMHYKKLGDKDAAKKVLEAARRAANRSGEQKEFYVGAINAIEEDL